MKLRQFVVENYRISLHYKAGIAKVALQSTDSHFTVHCYRMKVEDMREAFALYKAYNQFVDVHHTYDLLAFAINKNYGASIVGRYLDELVSEIELIKQKVKDMEEEEQYVFGNRSSSFQ